MSGRRWHCSRICSSRIGWFTHWLTHRWQGQSIHHLWWCSPWRVCVRTLPTTQKTYIGNNSIQHSAIWVWNLDTQQKDQRQTAGIWNVLLPMDPTYQLDRAKNKLWNMWQTQNWKGSATKSHSEETLFGHICRIEDNRKLKTLMFEIVDRRNKWGRPCRQWMDDIVSWCKTGLQELNSLAQDSSGQRCEWLDGCVMLSYKIEFQVKGRERLGLDDIISVLQQNRLLWYWSLLRKKDKMIGWRNVWSI